jgi:hypothetical protein
MREMREFREIKHLGKLDPSQKDGVKKIGGKLAEGLKLSWQAILIARSVWSLFGFQRAMIPFQESVLMMCGMRGVVKVCGLS